MTDSHELRERVLHYLSIYVKISPTMLQTVMQARPAEWKPILEDMIAEGVVERGYLICTSPTGRQCSHTVLRLKEEFLAKYGEPTFRTPHHSGEHENGYES